MKKDPYLKETLFRIPDLFAGILDGKGWLLDANRAALKFVDRKLEDLAGKKFWNTLWWDHPEQVQEQVKKTLESRYPRPWAGHYARFMASPPRFCFVYKLSHSSPSTRRGILRDFDKQLII